MAPREVPGDASTLIYLAKADAFTEASTCIRTILVTPAVWREAVEEGERIGAPEVGRIRAAQERGLLRRVALSPDAEVEAEAIRASHRLGLGESEVIALGRGLGWAIVDEGRASRVARSLGIRTLSTLFLPVMGHRKRELTQQEATELLRRLAVAANASAEAVLAIERHLGGQPR